MSASGYQLDNNTEMKVRTVIISQLGMQEWSLEPAEKLLIPLQHGKKVMVSWDQRNGQIVDFHSIQVNRPASFRVCLATTKMPGGAFNAINSIDVGDGFDPRTVDPGAAVAAGDGI